MPKITRKTQWLQTIAWLRKTFPPSRPVNVRCTPRTRTWTPQADCGYEKGRFLIRIRRSLNFSQRIDALIHEWAHAMTWFGSEAGVDDHGGEWGLAYARVYKAWVEWSDTAWIQSAFQE